MVVLKMLRRTVVQVDFTMTELITKSGARKAAGPLNVGSDFYEALDDRVRQVVERAVDRAKANGRRTVKARDI